MTDKRPELEIMAQSVSINCISCFLDRAHHNYQHTGKISVMAAISDMRNKRLELLLFKTLHFMFLALKSNSEPTTRL